MKFFQITLFITTFLLADLYVEPVASDFDKPVYVLSMPDNNNNLLVVEQKGVILFIENGIKTTYLDISDRVHRPLFPGDERGLLGFVFDPKYLSNSYFYVNYINKDGNTVISRFKANGEVADSLSENIILELEQPYSNHNGGMMAFGPDNYLYIAVGDGGSGGDPLNNAQNLNNFFGSILRLDVDVKNGYQIPDTNPFIDNVDALSEIWAYGLRNPWRFSFDKKTGDLYIGDVGQNSWEEINFQSANSSGGENYGWNQFEGFDDFIENPDINNAIAPIHVYPNNANIYKVILGWDEDDVYGCSITGGYVYNGKKIESLKGYYLFADYCTGRIWAFQFVNSQIQNLKELTEDINLGNGKGTISISSFGEDADGELYIIDYSGDIYRLNNE